MEVGQGPICIDCQDCWCSRNNYSTEEAEDKEMRRKRKKKRWDHGFS